MGKYCCGVPGCWFVNRAADLDMDLRLGACTPILVNIKTDGVYIRDIKETERKREKNFCSWE